MFTDRADHVQATATAFLSYIEDNPTLSYTSSLFTPASFRDEFGEAIFPDSGLLPAGKHSLSIRDTEILLKWLSRDCGAVVMDDKVGLGCVTHNTSMNLSSRLFGFAWNAGVLY